MRKRKKHPFNIDLGKKYMNNNLYYIIYKGKKLWISENYYLIFVSNIVAHFR
jgi:hypothetical protein